MLSSWGSWIAEQATAVTQLASEVVQEIIAEGQGTMQGTASNTSARSNLPQTDPFCFWDVVNDNDDADDSGESGSPRPTSIFPTSKYWSANPMQWSSLIRQGLSRDVNSFVISPEALIFESSLVCAKNRGGGDDAEDGDDNDEDDDASNIKTVLEKMIVGRGEGGGGEDGEGEVIKIFVPATATSTANLEDQQTQREPPILSGAAISTNKVLVPDFFIPSEESIRKMLQEDTLLADLRYDLVPKWVKEADFWRNFAFRVYLLSKTESVEQAIEVLKIVNEEHRSDRALAGAAVSNDTSKKCSGNDQAETEVDTKEQLDRESLFRSVLKALPATDELLIQSQSQRFHSNRSLKKKGFGVKRIAELQPQQPQQRQVQVDAVPQASCASGMHHSSDVISFSELFDLIHATGEVESWQQNFLARAKKQLANVHSSVSMLAKLIGEIDEAVAHLGDRKNSNYNNNNNNNNVDSNATATSSSSSPSAELPSIELVQSIAESCRFHKGRVAALIGEIQSAPCDRVDGNVEIDPERGRTTAQLQRANAQLGEVLVKQAVALRSLGDKIRSISTTMKHEQLQQERQGPQLQGEAECKTKTEHGKRADDKVQDDGVKVAVNNNNNNKSDNNGDDDEYDDLGDDCPDQVESLPKDANKVGAEFVAHMPWDDDDE